MTRRSERHRVGKEQSGHEDEAIKLYESIVSRASDPEFKGALAALYRGRGRTAEADELARKAKEQYEALIAKYPEAMAAHATEFYLGEGHDPRRAVELAKADVELTSTLKGFTALARAELANKNVAAAKRAIDAALALPVRAAETFAAAAAVAEAEGDEASRARYMERAHALNARLGRPPSR